MRKPPAGVSVKPIVRGEPDMPIVKSRRAVALITIPVKGGVQVYEYRRPLHGKVALMDDLKPRGRVTDPPSLSLNL